MIDDLKTKVAEVLALAKKGGATQAEASASFGSGLSVNVRKQSVETLEYTRDQGLGLTVYFGKRKASASTSDLSPGAIGETAKKACSLARYTAEDDCAGLADANRMARTVPTLDLHHPWGIEAPEAIELATRCEAAALGIDERITNSEGASVASHEGCHVYGNTHGFLEGYWDTSHSISCAVIASEAQQMERDGEYTVARDASELDNALEVGREAGRRAVARLGAVKLDTRKAPVLFPARIARSLMGHFLGAISGGAQYRKATFWPEAVGQQVMAKCITIDERPHLPKALGSAPFDGEGVETRDRRLIDAGVLQGYVLGSYYARKLKLQSTGNAGGIHNLVVESTGESFEELLAAMDEGFMVTELMGQGIDPVTGDYSRGAAGFWVEKGKIMYPVSEITIAGNLKDMYKDILAVGTDTDVRGGVRTGSVLVREMTIAGS
jgi:PmbA protein